jgi:hypothetical protein
LLPIFPDNRADFDLPGAYMSHRNSSIQQRTALSVISQRTASSHVSLGFFKVFPLIFALIFFPRAAAAQGSISGTITNGANAGVSLSGAAPVLVQSSIAAANTGQTQINVLFSSIAKTGDTILVFARYGGTTITSVVDNSGNVYNSVLGPTMWGVAPNDTDRSAQVFAAKKIAGGHTITVTISLAGTSTHDTYVSALEYSGVDGTNPVNATAVGTGTYPSNGAPTTANMTTSIANTEIVATAWDSNESYVSTQNGSGFTTDVAAGINSISGGSGWANLTEDRNAPTAGVWNASTTASPKTVDWVIQAVALKPSGIPQNTTADANGIYNFSRVSNGSYTLTPTKTNESFTPAFRSVVVAGSPVTNVNFTASSNTGSISGLITPDADGTGTTVTLSGTAPALVQSATGTSSVGTSQVTVPFGSSTNPGDAILVFLRFAGTTVSSITDNQLSTYVSAAGPTQWGTAGGGATDRIAQVFVTKSIVGGGLTITVNFSGTSDHGVYAVAMEYSGVDPTNPINAFAVGTGTTQVGLASPATGTMTTTVSNAALAATAWDSNDSFTAAQNGSGYTTVVPAGISSIAGGSGWGNLTEQSIASTAGTWDATTSSSSSIVDWAMQVVALTPGASQTTSADSGGNYSFNNIKNGTYTVSASKLGYTFNPGFQQVTVNGALVPNVNFAATETVGIAGTLKGVSGNPISGATVSYNGGSQTASTDTNGNYTLSIPAGTYSVTAAASGFQSQTQQNITVSSATVTTVDFTLTASTGQITGTVTSSTGAAVSGASVTYSGGSTTTAANGSYTVNNLLPGTYSVKASATGFQSQTQSVIVTAGVATTADFTLAPLGKISGTVLNSGGVAVSGATVSYSGGSIKTGTNGSYTFSNVVPGTYNITVTATNYHSSTQSVIVALSATSTVNFALSPLTGGLKGKTSSKGGVAIAGATITISGGVVSTKLTSTTNLSGNFSFTNIPVGSYSVSASKAGFTTQTKNVSVSSSSTATVNFTLK